MKFGNPFFLFGLFALLIPIIIHLFNFRRFKKVYFSDITFLKELKEETQSKNKLKNYLILLSRLLFIGFLVLAFAQPFIPNNTSSNTGGKLISIYVDNSFSMNATGEQGRLLDVAKKAAIEIAKGYKETDKFQILTNDFEGKHQRFYTREEFIKLTEEVKESASSRKISEISSRQKNAFNQTDPSFKLNKHSYLLSDFQKSMIKEDMVKPDSQIVNYFIPLQSNKVNNIYIDSVWFEEPVFRVNENNKLFAKVVNRSDEPIENKPLTFYIDEKSNALATLNIEANSESIINLPINIKQPGLVNACLGFDDFPINYDDKFYFSFLVYDQLKVVLIEGAKSTPFLKTLLKNDSFFNLTVLDETQIQISELNGKQLIVLNEVNNLSSSLIQDINKFVTNGSSAFIIPSDEYTDKQISALNGLNIPIIGKADTGNFILEKPDLKNKFFASVFDEQKMQKNEKIDLPLIKFKYPIKLNELSEPILNFVNGDNYLFAQKLSKGKIYVLSSPLKLNRNTLAKHSLFIPIVYKIALSSLSINQLYYKIGNIENRFINANQNGNDEILKIQSTNKKNESIPSQNITNQGIRITIGDNTIKEPGNYKIINSQNEIIDGISLNYNRLESELTFLNEDEIKEYSTNNNLKINLLPPKNSDFTHLVKQESEGKKLWKWCVIIALISLITETLLIRYLK